MVFHLPQEVVNTIKREAHRNVVLQQMLLDMFRSDKHLTVCDVKCPAEGPDGFPCGSLSAGGVSLPIMYTEALLKSLLLL